VGLRSVSEAAGHDRRRLIGSPIHWPSATGYLGAIHFTSPDTKATVPADYRFTAADKGVHIFSYSLNQALVLRTPGTQWVRATDKATATITGAQTGIVVQ
jgi:hypothetical protein